MMTRDDTVRNLKHKLDLWNSDLDDLESRMEKYQDERRMELRQTLDELKEKRDEASKAFDKLKSASDDAFDDVRKGAQDAWDRMASSFDKAKQRFN